MKRFVSADLFRGFLDLLSCSRLKHTYSYSAPIIPITKSHESRFRRSLTEIGGRPLKPELLPSDRGCNHSTSVLLCPRDNPSPTIHYSLPTIPLPCSIFPPSCSTRQIQTDQNGTLWHRSHEKDGLGALPRPPSTSGLNSPGPRRTIPPPTPGRPAPGCSCS